jgi:large-conductance mechanosensitive channel
MTLASERLKIENSLLKLQITGKAQLILKSRGDDYIINDTRKYYAEAALSAGDFLSSFIFLIVCLLILFVVLSIQFVQRKGAVISKNKAKGESDETKTFNKDMSI